MPNSAVARIAACIAASACLLAPDAGARRAKHPAAEWRFAVSGDSRNCGDVVMPAIAAHVLADGALFYWHLGDFRWITRPDEDYHQLKPEADLAQYRSDAWGDFIEHQITPFGTLPVYLARGNHENVPPKTEDEYRARFAPWLDRPEIREQRLHAKNGEARVQTYYRWKQRNIQFITLDNGSPNDFDAAQLSWFNTVLDQAAADKTVRTVVLGMHEALPDSLSTGHSMNSTVQGATSGRIVYGRLLAFERRTGKHVYVLSSHSHFYLDNVYATACRTPENVLPGWIIGTAGAIRYRLPLERGGSHAGAEKTYGYLLATVAGDGSIRFDFKPVAEADVPASTTGLYTAPFVHACFDGNASDAQPEGADCQAIR